MSAARREQIPTSLRYLLIRVRLISAIPEMVRNARGRVISFQTQGLDYSGKQPKPMMQVSPGQQLSSRKLHPPNNGVHPPPSFMHCDTSYWQEVGLQPKVPPLVNPSEVQVAPLRFVPSHCSPWSIVPSPQVAPAVQLDTSICEHPERQSSEPPSNPRLWHESVPKSVPSQASGACLVPSPQL